MTTDTDIKENSRRVWAATPAGSRHAAGADPGTREFFEAAFRRRSEEEIPWLTCVIPFESTRDKKVLELGCGAGYDAYTFCRAGADYTGIDITPQNIARAGSHLALYDLAPRLEEGDAENLLFANESFDIVYSNGVLHHTPDMARSFREAARVLKPGGRFWVILYHKHSVYFWASVWFTDFLLKGGFRRSTLKERLSRIEYTSSGALPLVNVYSRSAVRSLLGRCGFQVEDICVRKLAPEDLPDLPIARSLWRKIPRTWLDRAGRVAGWYVIAKAVKR